MCSDRPPEGLLGHVVEEGAPAVDLHHRQELAVALLELRDAGDVDLLELERELLRNAGDRVPRPLAQVAPAGAEEDDAGYG